MLFSPQLKSVMSKIPMKMIKIFANIYQILCDILETTGNMQMFVQKYEELVHALIALKEEVNDFDP